MERIRDVVGRWLPFAWWLLMVAMLVLGFACCVAQACSGSNVFLAVCGAFGTGISVLIFAWQAYGEFLEAREE
jgi:hypothetical protein